jgi:hypothetical protein
MNSLVKFVNQYKTFGPEWTVLNLFGEKYAIPESTYENFLELLAETEKSENYRFVERNIVTGGPIQIELFFVYEHGTIKRIDEAQIALFLQCYTTILKQYYHDTETLEFYILRKPIDFKRCEQLEIICPNLTIPYNIQRQIRTEILTNLETIFANTEYTNSIPNIFEERIISYNTWNIHNFIAKDRLLAKYSVDKDNNVGPIEIPETDIDVLKEVSIRYNHSKITPSHCVK